MVLRSTLKRINFNMAPECARLLKSSCALLDVSVSEFCYSAVAEKFRQLCKKDERFLNILINENLPEGSRASLMRQQLLEDRT